MRAILILIWCLMPTLATADAADGSIATVAAEFGNIETTLTQEDLDRLEIRVGDDFQLTHKDTTVTVRLGRTYEDVERGEWIAFINWEDKLRVARSFANAAETLGAEDGDPLTIARIAPAEE